MTFATGDEGFNTEENGIKLKLYKKKYLTVDAKCVNMKMYSRKLYQHVVGGHIITC